MTKASDNIYPKVIFAEGAAPSTPSASQVKLYAKSDGLLYSKDDAGAETLVSGGGGGGGGEDGTAGGTLVIGDWSGATTQTVTGTATWTEGRDENRGRDVLSCKFYNQTASDVSAILKAVGGSSPWRIQTAFRTMSQRTNYTMCGPCFTDGTATSSKIIWGQLTETTTENRGSAYLYRDGTLTAFDSAFTTYADPWAPLGGQVHMRLTWVSANTWRLELSPDAVSWTTFDVADPTSTMTPTHVGLAVSNYGGGSIPRIVSFDYFLQEAG